MQSQEQVKSNADRMRSKIEDVINEGKRRIPVANGARDWFVKSMNELEKIARDTIYDVDSLSKKASKQRVSLMFGYGHPRLLVNGKEIDIPEYLDADDPEKDTIQLFRIFKGYCEEEGGLTISGEKVLDERQIDKLADWMGKYWEEIYDILGVD